MPAGYGTRCEKCYWKKVLEKRIAINAGAFGIPAMAQHFESFGKWLADRVGVRKAAITLNRYLSFFTDMERELGGITTYAALLHRFGAERLRRFRLPMAWLSKTAGISPDVHARMEDSERRRIEVLIETFSQETPAAESLGAYQEMLNTKLISGRTTLHSMRLALRPAVSLLLAADSSGRTLPNQAALDCYMQHAPGQMAAITGFVNLLNQKYGTGLSLQSNAKRLYIARRKKLEAKLMEMIRSSKSDALSSQEWISAALEYFHGLPQSVGRTIGNDQIEADKRDGGAIVLLGDKTYWIPMPFNV